MRSGGRWNSNVSLPSPGKFFLDSAIVSGAVIEDHREKESRDADGSGCQPPKKIRNRAEKSIGCLEDQRLFLHRHSVDGPEDGVIDVACLWIAIFRRYIPVTGKGGIFRDDGEGRVEHGVEDWNHLNPDVT